MTMPAVIGSSRKSALQDDREGGHDVGDERDTRVSRAERQHVEVDKLRDRRAHDRKSRDREHRLPAWQLIGKLEERERQEQQAADQHAAGGEYRPFHITQPKARHAGVQAHDSDDSTTASVPATAQLPGRSTPAAHLYHEPGRDTDPLDRRHRTGQVTSANDEREDVAARAIPATTCRESTLRPTR